jgi:RNA polymerase sigma-70 factor (ECF subfamily)
MPLSHSEEDQALLSRIVARESAAFGTLYARYAPRVRGYLALRLHHPDLVDDVLQDVMLAIWQHAARVPTCVPLMAWLCGIARYKAGTALARAGTRPLAQPLPDDMDHDDPEAVCLRREQISTLYRALSTLPLCEQKALKLHVLQGYSYQEVADLTGEPASTVRTHVSRARQRLRVRFGITSLPVR